MDANLEVVNAVYRAAVVLLVTLDVGNVFNSARWIDMLGTLERYRNSFFPLGKCIRSLNEFIKG